MQMLLMNNKEELEYGTFQSLWLGQEECSSRLRLWCCHSCGKACRRVTDSQVGNVFQDRLADLWVCEMEQYRQYDKFEKCSKCELGAWCRGCPAVANGTNGSFYAADPQCWKEIRED